MPLTTISGRSPVAADTHHALARIGRLSSCLDHGFLELDDNAPGHGMRAIAPGRKNDLFVGSEAGGEAAAIAYIPFETAKLSTVDPHVGLADTTAPIPDDKMKRADDLLPWRRNDSGQAGLLRSDEPRQIRSGRIFPALFDFQPRQNFAPRVNRLRGEQSRHTREAPPKVGLAE